MDRIRRSGYLLPQKIAVVTTEVHKHHLALVKGSLLLFKTGKAVCYGAAELGQVGYTTPKHLCQLCAEILLCYAVAITDIIL